MRKGVVVTAAVAGLLCACADQPAVAAEPSVETAATTTNDNYAAFGAVLARHQAMSARVERISRALNVANAPLCDQTRLDAGFSSHSLSDYPDTLQPLALHFMDLDEEGRFVRAVVPGSPADAAGIRRGDRIVSGYPVEADRPLVLDSGETLFRPSLDAPEACDIPAFVINADTPNASTDGREIDLTSTLLDQVGDDSALAFIIAHEMAHVLRGHSPDGPRWAAELEADADALTLMRNAGFDVDGTVAGWESGVEVHRESQAVSATHPPLAIRLKNLQDARADLSAREAGLLRLSPAD